MIVVVALAVVGVVALELVQVDGNSVTLELGGGDGGACGVLLVIFLIAPLCMCVWLRRQDRLSFLTG